MPELPGGSDHDMPHAEVTLEACGDAVLDAVRAGDGPSVVVGHSWGGYPITAAAQKNPSQIARLVYLCAYVPRDGLSMVELRRFAKMQNLAPLLELSDDGQSYWLPEEHQRGIFYQDCPDDAVALAAARLGPQAARPQREPLDDTARARALPRSYIRCAEDRTIDPDLQAEMAAGLPAPDRHEMATGHSPFFADPDGLARLLDRIAKE